MLLFCVLLVGTTVQAQAVTPITIGENTIGSIAQANAPADFSITVAVPGTVNVQVLAVTPGFAPTFSVIAPSGIIVATAANNGSQTIVQAAANLATAGTYIIRVNTANGTTGQFLVSVQAGAPAAPPQPLAPGQVVNGSVSQQTPRQAYSFAGAFSDVLLVNVRSGSPTVGPVVALRDALTGEILAMNGSRLTGGRFRIPPGGANYVLEVSSSGGAAPDSFAVCLETESGSIPCAGFSSVTQAQQSVTIPTPFIIQQIAQPTAPPTTTPIPAFQPVQIPANGPCQVASRSGSSINVRNAPNLNATVLGQLSPTISIAVIGRVADNTWYQVNLNGIIGWLSATVVNIGGNCIGVPVIAQPTPTFTPSLPPQIVTATFTPTATATIPVVLPTLNFSLPPNFGSTSLVSGFVPDPFTVGLTSGGSVNVSYLGGGCTGFASSAPDFSVNYTSGAFPTLRFYFIGGGDTTMIINTPGGSYVCVDDSFGTLNPTIDFNGPSSGRYDIWIGSFSQGTNISGTLNVTENTGNHP